jgi:hypothetical protein
LHTMRLRERGHPFTSALSSHSTPHSQNHHKPPTNARFSLSSATPLLTLALT